MLARTIVIPFFRTTGMLKRSLRYGAHSTSVLDRTREEDMRVKTPTFRFHSTLPRDSPQDNGSYNNEQPTRNPAASTPSYKSHSHYDSQSLYELCRGLAIFATCRIAALPGVASTVDLWLRQWGAAHQQVYESTLYPYFCAGATAEDLQPVVQKLQSQYGVGSILYYVAEEGSDDNLATFLEAIQFAKRLETGWVALKVTALLENTSILKRVSLAVATESRRLLENSYPESLDWTDLALESEDMTLLLKLQDRLQTLAKAAVDANVRLILDAEQWEYQDAIDAMVLSLQKQYNQEKTACIFHTYQCYRTDTLSRLQRDLERSRRHNYTPGIKLVRGAYLDYERQCAAKDGRASPVFSTIQDTHHCYHTAMRLCGSFPGDVMCATHNAQSLQQMQALQNEFPATVFRSAQLYGMMDHLTYDSSQPGRYKYIPYGPVSLAVAFLLRRAEENGSALAGGEEMGHRWAALWRRVTQVAR